MTEKVLKRNIVKNIILKGWNMLKGLPVTEVSQNVHLFPFEKEEDCARIICDDPWTIMGNLLNVKQWSSSMAFQDVKLDFFTYWVQFLGLPLRGFNAANAIKLGEGREGCSI